MYDIDPPGAILRLSDYRKGGSLGANPPSFAAQLDRYMAEKADRWARLHEAEKSAGRDALVFRACGSVNRIKALRVADGDLADALDAAL